MGMGQTSFLKLNGVDSYNNDGRRILDDNIYKKSFRYN